MTYHQNSLFGVHSFSSQDVFRCWNDILTLLDSRGSGVSVSTVITLSSASFSILGHLMGAASFILVVFIEITCEQAYLV